MSRNNHCSEAFFRLCRDAQPAKAAYVSLYVEHPFYGGPQEGGWWGSDTELVAYHKVSTEQEAEAVCEQVKQLAETLTAESKRAFGRQCAAECEWLEARGLDADFLPEPDGESRYWVATETSPGSRVQRGSRYYE